MKYQVTYRGMVVKEFGTVGEMDQYLADRVWEWTGLGPGHNAHLGRDYVELVNDRGTKVTLTFTPPPENSLVSDNALTKRLAFE